MNQANTLPENLNLGLVNQDLSQQIQERFNKEHNHDGINSAKLSLSSVLSVSNGTSLPVASSYPFQFFYLTTTDTIYVSNGTSWIAIN